MQYQKSPFTEVFLRGKYLCTGANWVFARQQIPLSNVLETGQPVVEGYEPGSANIALCVNEVGCFLNVDLFM